MTSVSDLNFKALDGSNGGIKTDHEVAGCTSPSSSLLIQINQNSHSLLLFHFYSDSFFTHFFQANHFHKSAFIVCIKMYLYAVSLMLNIKLNMLLSFSNLTFYFLSFLFLCLQDQVKSPKESKSKTAETAEGKAAEVLEQITEEGQDGDKANLNSHEDVVVDEIVIESRTKRIQHATKQQVDNIKKVFSKEQMEKTKLKTKENLEKTKQKTRENLEKTRQRTRDNLEKTKHSLEKKMGKLGSRVTPNLERRAKMKSSRDKMKKSLTPNHPTYARSKTTVYRVPPFTFHVKKIREGEEEEEEVVQNAEMVEVTDVEAQPEGEELGPGVEVEDGELVNVDGPEMHALLEVTEDSLVKVEPEGPK